MNESLQELEIKVENEGATPQGKLSADEWNIVVEALKKIDNDSALWATQSWVEEQQYLTEITSGMIESVLGYQPYDGDTNRLGFLTSSALNGYTTQSWVNTALAGYLPLSGGTMARNSRIYNAADPNTNYGAIGFNSTHNAFGSPYFPTKLRSSTDMTVTMGLAEFTLLHSGNYSTLLANGTINGSLTATSFIGDLAGQATAASLLRKTTSNSWCVANGNALDIYNSNASKRFWFGYSLPEGSPYATNEWHFGASDGTGENSGKVYAASFIGNLTGTADSATNADTLDGKHATDLVETKKLGASSNSLDLNSRKSEYTWLSTAWAFEGSNNVLNQPWERSAANVWTLPGLYPLQLARFYTSSVIKVRGCHGSTWTDWKDIAFTDSNVASATKLATPRTIWGQSFDGTGNVSGRLDDVEFINFVGSWLQIGLERNESSAVQNIKIQSHGGKDLLINPTGTNVAIGGTTADAKLHVYGNIKTSGFVISDTRMYSYGYLMTNTGLSYCGLVQNSLVSSVGDSRDIWLYNEYMTNICGRTGVSIDGASAGVTIKGNLLTTGGITMYSQRSLKNILSYDGLSLEQLSVIKPIKFTWKDGRDNRYHVGGVADDMATVVPEVVYSANDFLTMDYGNAGFYVAASLIKPVINHEQRIQQLEQENKALREEFNQLRQSA